MPSIRRNFQEHTVKYKKQANNIRDWTYSAKLNGLCVLQTAISICANNNTAKPYVSQ